MIGPKNRRNLKNRHNLILYTQINSNLEFGHLLDTFTFICRSKTKVLKVRGWKGWRKVAKKTNIRQIWQKVFRPRIGIAWNKLEVGFG